VSLIELVVRPLAAVSPSTYGRLRSWKVGKECALRLACSSTKPLLAPSAASKIGDIVHEVMEEAFQEMKRSDAEALWDEKSRRMDALLASDWVTRGLVPLSSTARGYTLKRLMSLRLACNLNQTRVERQPDERPPAGLAAIKERLIKSPDGQIRGKVDLVMHRAGGWHLVDYKSGTVAEDDSGEGLQVKKSYELQLLLYAALLQEAEGIAITSAALKTLDGKEHVVSVDVAGAEAVAAEARGLLLQFNQHLQQCSNPLLDLATPMAASPQDETYGCVGCSFRPACQAYISAEKKATEGGFWPRDLFGTVASIEEAGAKLRLTLRGLNGDVSVKKIVTLNASLERHPHLEGLQVGMRVGIFDLAPCRAILSDGPQTCFYRLV
jgi:hypothetical protein